MAKNQINEVRREKLVTDQSSDIQKRIQQIEAEKKKYQESQKKKQDG